MNPQRRMVAVSDGDGGVRRFATYHLRWQASTVVMLGPMWCLTEVVGLAGWLALPLVQVVGACLFYPVDRWIFSGE